MRRGRGGFGSHPSDRSQRPPFPPVDLGRVIKAVSAPLHPLRLIHGWDAAPPNKARLFFLARWQLRATHTHTLLSIAGPIHNARLKSCSTPDCFGGVRRLREGWVCRSRSGLPGWLVFAAHWPQLFILPCAGLAVRRAGRSARGATCPFFRAVRLACSYAALVARHPVIP